MVTNNNKITNSNNFQFPTHARGLKNKTLFDEFIFWYALPKPEKINLGIETQRQFGEYNNISERTLTTWIDRPEFMPAVKALWKKWGKFRTPTVVAAIYKSAVGGGKEAPQAQKLWMQVIEDFTEKTENTETKKVELGIGDIRFMIEQLPEELRKKHYGHLRELTEDIVAYRDARDTESDDWDARPEIAIQDEANNDAQDIPNKESSNAVAKSHKASIRADMVGPISESNHQSAERWW